VSKQRNLVRVLWPILFSIGLDGLIYFLFPVPRLTVAIWTVAIAGLCVVALIRYRLLERLRADIEILKERRRQELIGALAEDGFIAVIRNGRKNPK
jgi:hypothetical protein